MAAQKKRVAKAQKPMASKRCQTHSDGIAAALDRSLARTGFRRGIGLIVSIETTASTLVASTSTTVDCAWPVSRDVVVVVADDDKLVAVNMLLEAVEVSASPGMSRSTEGVGVISAMAGTASVE